MAETFEITTADQDPAQTTVILSGQIDEFADFSGFNPASSKKKIVFNFKNVSRINSIGLQKWIHFITQLSGDVRYEFADCPISIVNQINMFHGFLGQPAAQVNSFEIPYYCESCNKPETRMVNTIEVVSPNSEIEVPEIICPSCGEKYAFDGVERKYFAFILREKSS